MLSSNDPSGRCVCCACLCCYGALDFSMITCCVAEKCDCLCFRQSCCLAVGAKSLGCLFCCSDDRYSTMKAEECCKIRGCCCDLALITPQVLCANATKVLCLQAAMAFPFNEKYLGVKDNQCVCAICFVQCCPKCGFCVPPPPCKAIQEMKAPLKVVPMHR